MNFVIKTEFVENSIKYVILLNKELTLTPL
jgi:hypothetical protein